MFLTCATSTIHFTSAASAAAATTTATIAITITIYYCYCSTAASSYNVKTSEALCVAFFIYSFGVLAFFFQEKEETLRRRNMTDDERRMEDMKLGKHAGKDKAKIKFMQKYYHKGAFYMVSAFSGLAACTSRE